MAKPHESMIQVAEHQFFKAGLPLVTAALIGSVTYLFSTVLDLEKEVFLMREGKIPAIETKVDGIVKDLEKLEDRFNSVHRSRSWGTSSDVPPENYYNEGNPRNILKGNHNR